MTEPLTAGNADLAVEASLLSSSVVALRPLRERLDPATLRPLGLSPRECQVLAHVTERQPSKQIAAEIDVLPATVESHLERIDEKLCCVSTRTAAAAAAFRAAEV